MPVSIIIIEYPADTDVKIHQGQKIQAQDPDTGRSVKNDWLHPG